MNSYRGVLGNLAKEEKKIEGYKNETEFTQHFEFYYEFELERFHLGPQFDISLENNEIHYMLGLHFGINF